MTIPSPELLKRQIPLSSEDHAFILHSRWQAANIAQGKDHRMVIITGPCSIHHIDAAKEYALRLSELAKQVQEHCFLVMRVYVEKPRTTVGWKGLLYDPFLDGSDAIEVGLQSSRKLFLDLTKLQLPIATEFVDPLAAPYLEDLVSWGFIGARTSASQPHRQLASSFPFPTGFKNSLDGNIDNAIQGALAASFPHSFLALNTEGKIGIKRSQGNPFSHIVLRGSQEKINYDALSIRQALDKLNTACLTPRVMVDCSHGNCQKDYRKQQQAFMDLLDYMKTKPEEVMGLMLESYLEEGQQPFSENPSSLLQSLSITDGCIDWKTTEELILEAFCKKSIHI